MPAASDYQFFRKTDLLKSISRDAVCPLLNCITFRHVKIADLNPLAEELGLNNGAVISSNRKMVTLFLLYTDEHRHILNQEMEEFCSKMQEMGVACKAADFKEI